MKIFLWLGFACRLFNHLNGSFIKCEAACEHLATLGLQLTNFNIFSTN